MIKKLILFAMLACSLILNTASSVNADNGTVPNNYIASVSAAANTNGLRQLIDCSKSGMTTVSAIVSAGANATVVFNTIGANQDGTPNMGFVLTNQTMLSVASGTSAPLNIPVGAFSFYQISSSTTGVALTYIAGCR
jgi:hypothetical protein